MKRALSIVLGVLVAACSSSSQNGGANDVDAGVVDAGPQPSPNNCVKPGYAGNEKGVGAYCLPGKGCPSGSPASVCTADHSTINTKWFCTVSCSTDDDCGKEAYCGRWSEGTTCVPFACGTPPSDAGAGADDSGGVSNRDSGPVPPADGGVLPQG